MHRRPRRKPRRRRGKRILIVLAALFATAVVIAFVALPRVVAPVLRGKLEALVSNHLHADLRLAELSYRFPYTVELRDARLVAHADVNGGDGVEVIHLPRATLALDSFPMRSGPLRIRSIELDEPTVRVVRSARGAVSGQSMLKRDVPVGPVDPRMKLSDLFRLRRLTLRGGKVVFEDHAHPDAPPMVWENLSTDLAIAPRQASVYAFHYSAQGAPMADLSAAGTIDIDALVVALDSLKLAVRVDPDGAASSVPAFVQDLARRYDTHGALHVEGAGRVELRNLTSAAATASIELRDCRARVGPLGTVERLNLKLALEKHPERPELLMRVTELVASRGGGTFAAGGADGAIDWSSRTWALNVPGARADLASAGSIAMSADLRGSLDRRGLLWDQSRGVVTFAGATLRPRRFEHDVTGVNGTLRFADGQLTTESFRARYGGDVWSFGQARVVVRDLPGLLTYNDVAGQVTFGAPRLPYPGGFGKVVAGLRPSGPFAFNGQLVDHRVPDGPSDQWDFVGTSERGAFALTPREIPLTNIRGEAHFTRNAIEIRRLLANLFDGALACSGTIDPRKPVSYDGEVSFEGVDLGRLVEAARRSPESNVVVVGRLAGNLSVAADRASLDALRAEGELLVHDGELWQIPVIDSVVREARVARERLRAGEAAAVISVAEGKVHVRHAAVASPSIGLQGWGVVGLDGALDLAIVAAPLGDWEQQLKNTNVPIISDVVGGVAGAMQKVLNTATSTLLYEFRVTGTAAKPELAAVPTPVLTDAAAFVFEGMLKRDKDLLKPIRERGEPKRK